jgi:hypothetical protein
MTDFLSEAVMTAAFGGPGRAPLSNDVPCWDEACEHRTWGKPDGGVPDIDEAFEADVQRVMWEQNVGDRTARDVVHAERRLDARKAELRAARAAS